MPISWIDVPNVAAARLMTDGPDTCFFWNRDTQMRVDLRLDFPIEASEVLQASNRIDLGANLRLAVASWTTLATLKEIAVRDRNRPEDVAAVQIRLRRPEPGRRGPDLRGEPERRTAVVRDERAQRCGQSDQRASFARMDARLSASCGEWIPWLLAFGLGPQVDAWSTTRVAEGASTFRYHLSSTGGGSASAPSASGGAFTGFAGGRSGGAGGGAAWASAAAGVAAGVSPPSSSSDSGRGGGGNSGGGSSGGGGGGW